MKRNVHSPASGGNQGTGLTRDRQVAPMLGWRLKEAPAGGARLALPQRRTGRHPPDDPPALPL